MRGEGQQQGGMWSYIPAEERVPADQPLRLIRKMTESVLRELSPLLIHTSVVRRLHSRRDRVIRV